VVIQSRIRIPDRVFHSLIIAEWGILLAFLTLADFYDTWRNDWRRQENEFTTFWERFGRHPDTDSGNPDSNLDHFLLEALTLAEVCALIWIWNIPRSGEGLECSNRTSYANFCIVFHSTTMGLSCTVFEIWARDGLRGQTTDGPMLASIAYLAFKAGQQNRCCQVILGPCV